ncbi:MAG TPA: flagellar FliJ family protein [Acidobacteriaceae bacterium]|jgi:flagellar FliJ protein|nr:flagellar FliJ family protein [Acidobacteriaceae bacterium]
MAFRFSLATVLRVRESLERNEERALQKIQLAMAHLAHQIDELTSKIVKLHEAREKTLQQPISASHLHMLLEDATSAAEQKKSLIENLHLLEQQRDQQILRYQAAHRDRETLTDLSDNQKDAYEQDQLRAQQRVLDDIFMARRHQS